MYSGGSQVFWDVKNKRQREEAKASYMEAKRLGRRILTDDDLEVKNFGDIFDKGFFRVEAEGKNDVDQMALHLFDETGDRRLMWRPDRIDEVKEANDLFNEYVSKGWKAYAVHRTDPKLKGVRVYEFNPDSHEVIFDDRTPEEKLKNFDRIFQDPKVKVEEQKKTRMAKIKDFAKHFDEIKILPKTYPG